MLVAHVTTSFPCVFGLGVFFKRGFKRSPSTVGGFWDGPPPSLSGGVLGAPPPPIEWGGFRALSLRGKTPPLNEGGGFQNAPPGAVAITVTNGRLGSWLGVIEPCQRPVGCEQRDVCQTDMIYHNDARV